ncbi:hypothetical protein ABIF65_000250 [Bradyrhizobium japonicum]|nr:hypothetical protein [Bradyrhizobium japonicum]MCP1776973.1 hypothetical protein [Bradyrhizobium japonicum]MCP1856457.1 hypothetical protein [Bradyrhizobium japonicum]MCP1887274.1 hypothetical protein [Bradyrhizobium japonicum]MCP1960027.1 hypothetical protein [Bradyrhizobium japonicum]
MKIYILAAIIAVSPTFSYAAREIPITNKTTGYFYHLKKMTPLRFACNGQYSSCEKDTDCCSGFICISKKCE